MTIKEFYEFANTKEGYWELFEGKAERLPSETRHALIKGNIMIQMCNYCQAHSNYDDYLFIHSVQTDLYQENKTDSPQNLLCSVVPDFLIAHRSCIQNGYIVGAPLLILEIWTAQETEAIQQRKKTCYQAAGVRYFIEIAASSFDIHMVDFYEGKKWHKSLPSSDAAFQIEPFSEMEIHPFIDIPKEWL